MKIPMTRSLITLLAVGLTTGACAGSDSDTAADSTAGSSSEATTDRESTPTAQPRLVVASDSGVEIIGGSKLASLGQFDLASRPKLQVAGDDRHVFVLQSDSAKVGVVDAGTWSVAHGDHSHSYVKDPSLLKTTFDEGTSYHAVSDDERSVVWFDDDASFRSFDWKGLEDDSVEVQSVTTGAGHHGVAAPLSDGGFLASYAEGEDASGVLVLDAEGTETARIGGCEGLHGEAHAGDDAYAFGCSDGVLVVDESKGAKIASPVDGAGTRSLVGSHDAGVLAGNLTSETDETVGRKIALYDLEKQTSTAVDLGVEFASYARTDDQTIVLGTDGALHVIDDATGEVAQKLSVIDPWELTDEYSDPKPQLAVGDGIAWVTDPRDNSVIELDLGTGEERGRSTLKDVPTSLVVVNAPHDH